MSKRKRTRNRKPKKSSHHSPPKPINKFKEKRRSTIIILGGIIFLVLTTIIFFNLPFFKKIYTGDFFAPVAGLEDINYFPSFEKPSKKQKIKLEDYAGAEACRDCHKEQYDLWKTSTHGLAGGTPDSVQIISNYDSILKYGDAIVTPSFKNNYKFQVELSGGQKLNYNVDAVVGGGHMIGGGTQTYFSKFPDGTFKFLPFDYSHTDSTWFSQIKKNNTWIPVQDELFLAELSEWPPHRILGTNDNFANCQNCHGSQIQVTYNEKKKEFETKFTSLRINCESCHGPGKRHIELMLPDSVAKSEEIGILSFATASKDESLNICFQCHAVKDQVQKNYLSGDLERLEEYFSLKMPIIATRPYLEDGRVRKFAYQQNHLFSDCYLNGSMTCVDCHSPHSNQYRDINGRILEGKFDNDQCLSCHPSKAKNPEEHSYHKPDSTGNLCVTCHMPFLQSKNVGDHITFGRSDHTIPIPRPSFDTSIGIEDACFKCHRDKSIESLQKNVDDWYGNLKSHKPVISNLFNADSVMNRNEAAKKWLVADAQFPMAQVMGLSYFTEKFLTPDMPLLEDDIIEKLKQLSMDKDIDVKSFAMMSLHLAYGHKKEIRDYLIEQLKLHDKEEFKIRSRWALAMDYYGSVFMQKGQFDKGILMFKKALEIIPDDPFVLINLGNAYGNRGMLDRAINCFEKATDIQPNNETAWISLGTAYQLKGLKDKALNALQKAVDVKPILPGPYIILARAHLNRGDMQTAIDVLRQGLTYIPNDLSIIGFLNELQVSRFR